MYLFNNTFNDAREIKGFTKDEILQIKNQISKLNSDKLELDKFINSNFKAEILDLYNQYIENIRQFIELYLVSESEDSFYLNLKNEIQEELRLLSNNLSNLSANGRNFKRFLKDHKYLNEFLVQTKNLINETDTIISILGRHTKNIEKDYDNDINLWIEANKIKNLNFKLNKIPEPLNYWQEIQDLVIFLTSLIEAKTKIRIRSRKEVVITFHYDELYQFFLSKHDNKLTVYEDLIFLLSKNNIIEEYEGEDFINIVERKDIVYNLKAKMRPFILSTIENKLKGIINEVIEFDKKYDLEGPKGKLDLNALMKEKFKEFLPKIVEYYFLGLDKTFQSIINEADERNIDEFVTIVNSYYEKIDNLLFKIDEIDTWLLKFDQFLKPYENITNSLKRTLSSLISEIYRRKEEYMNYLNSIKDEGLRVDIRAYVDGKIAEVNKLISSYEDETSKIIKEELPQLREIRELLSEYKSKIDKIKEEVYIKLDTYKESNFDMYNVIKHWETNFTRKKQQLTFLLTLLINKIFKSFKNLIDEESILFAEITEITKQTENFEGLPLNFALSAFLAERLSEEELKERVLEINAKINQLTASLGLYQIEVAKLEEILTKKVKIRQGVAVSKVQCTVCHKNINFAKDKLITCPFCGSTYHYLCVADWLSKQNSCPMCMNHFLEPYSGLFETDEKEI
ncbi:MAG: RING finger domain-containing protein [Candidatus Hermodarchaeota archaeon]